MMISREVVDIYRSRLNRLRVQQVDLVDEFWRRDVDETLTIFGELLKLDEQIEKAREAYVYVQSRAEKL
jgi:hypothetical protein